MIRAKVGLKGGGRFIPESIDDFSSCGALSTTIATWDAFESIKFSAPIGEAARYDLKQAKLVTHFAHAAPGSFLDSERYPHLFGIRTIQNKD